MTIITEATKLAEMAALSRTTSTNGKGSNSPQIGRQRPVAFSSKKNPFAQIIVL